MRPSWRVISTLDVPASSVLHGADAEVARVVAVEGGRLAAAQLVADVLVADRDLDAARRERLGDRRAQHACRAAPRRGARGRARRAARPSATSRSAGSKHSAMPSAITATPSGRPSREPLHDRALERAHHVVERGSAAAGNSSGISVIVAPAHLPAPSARCPALRPIITTKNQRPVVRASSSRRSTTRGRVLARRLEAEGRDAVGQRQVVVDRLRHVHDARCARRPCRRRAWRRRRCRRRRS